MKQLPWSHFNNTGRTSSEPHPDRRTNQGKIAKIKVRTSFGSSHQSAVQRVGGVRLPGRHTYQFTFITIHFLVSRSTQNELDHQWKTLGAYSSWARAIQHLWFLFTLQLSLLRALSSIWSVPVPQKLIADYFFPSYAWSFKYLDIINIISLVAVVMYAFWGLLTLRSSGAPNPYVLGTVVTLVFWHMPRFLAVCAGWYHALCQNKVITASQGNIICAIQGCQYF